MVKQEEIQFSTKGNGDMHDLTANVQEIIAQSELKWGVAHIFAVGSTAALGMIEYEPGLQKDLPQFLNTLIPPGKQYHHELRWHDGNGHSHLQATLMGSDITVPFREKELRLGTWQQIIHLECDNRPRQRQVIVTLNGEK